MTKILISNILFFISVIGYAQNTIEGFWSTEQQPYIGNGMEREFSWGKRTVPRSFDIIVDLNSEPPTIEIYQFSTDIIIYVNEEENVTELTFYFARGNFNITMICHFNIDGTMWIEPLFGGFTFFRTGKDQIYYKIDGP